MWTGLGWDEVKQVGWSGVVGVLCGGMEWGMVWMGGMVRTRIAHDFAQPSIGLKSVTPGVQKAM